MHGENDAKGKKKKENQIRKENKILSKVSPVLHNFNPAWHYSSLLEIICLQKIRRNLEAGTFLCQAFWFLASLTSAAHYGINLWPLPQCTAAGSLSRHSSCAVTDILIEVIDGLGNLKPKSNRRYFQSCQNGSTPVRESIYQVAAIPQKSKTLQHLWKDYASWIGGSLQGISWRHMLCMLYLS